MIFEVIKVLDGNLFEGFRVTYNIMTNGKIELAINSIKLNLIFNHLCFTISVNLFFQTYGTSGTASYIFCITVKTSVLPKLKDI